MTKLSAEELAVLVETLAAIEHERWAHWQSYLHRQGDAKPDGSIMLRSDQVREWNRQISTPYSDLSDHEKDSDREQVWRYLRVLLERFGAEAPPNE